MKYLALENAVNEQSAKLAQVQRGVERSNHAPLSGASPLTRWLTILAFQVSDSCKQLFRRALIVSGDTVTFNGIMKLAADVIKDQLIVFGMVVPAKSILFVKNEARTFFCSFGLLSPPALPGKAVDSQAPNRAVLDLQADPILRHGRFDQILEFSGCCFHNTRADMVLRYGKISTY